MAPTLLLSVAPCLFPLRGRAHPPSYNGRLRKTGARLGIENAPLEIAFVES